MLKGRKGTEQLTCGKEGDPGSPKTCTTFLSTVIQYWVEERTQSKAQIPLFFFISIEEQRRPTLMAGKSLARYLYVTDLNSLSPNFASASLTSTLLRPTVVSKVKQEA